MKKLTNTGKEFIRTICKGNDNSLITGKYNYNLPFSRISNSGITFTANVIDHIGNTIIKNKELGEALIYWYDKYAELLDFDANLLAAQGYIESGFRLWHYSKNDSGSGLADLVSKRIYRHIIRTEYPETTESLRSPKFTEDEINKIIVGLTNPTEYLSYVYVGSETTPEISEVAINNRQQLHQNIINNPEISIKAQAIIMSEIGYRNNFIISNMLFAYNRNYLISDKNYPLLVEKTTKKFGDDFVKIGLDYVEEILRCLSDKDNNKLNKKITKPKGIWFGYDIDFSVDKFNSFLG